jgi:protein-S-isoprenylcysteine O-methyltransferase Ste14
VIGLYYLVRSEIELGDKILMPYKLDEILNAKSVTYTPYDGKGLEGLKTDGVYATVRHPLQCGMLALLIVANGFYTIDKILNVLIMGGGVFYGVYLE